MRAVSILRQRLAKSLEQIHAKRLGAIWRAVTGLVVGGRLWLTGLGRSLPGTARKKHLIKAIDRLLGNRRLHAEQLDIYRAVTRLLLAPHSRPVILVDWTPVGTKHHALVASVPIGGRALPLLQEVHPEKNQGKHRVHEKFLRRLRTLLPEGCRPIVVTDAGFRSNWFDAVLKRGWDFVGRVRHHTYVSEPSGDWVLAKTLHSKASPRARDLGWRFLTRTNPRQRRFVIVRKRRRPGPKKSKGLHSAKDEKCRRRAQEPWLLATSLGDEYAAHQIDACYQLRMQIEETFRDEKNPRFGWCFGYARSKSCRRYEVLLLLATLGMLAMVVLGRAAEAKGIHRGYQANTISSRRVLSFFVLAKHAVEFGDDTQVSRRALSDQIQKLRTLTSGGLV